MNPGPDYSASYLTVRTDEPDPADPGEQLRTDPPG
jgi:hypothetical protein